MTRRAWLAQAATLAGAACAAPGALAAPGGIASDARTLHALNRLAFGAAPGELQRARSLGVESWIQQQLRPDTMALPALLQQQLSSLPLMRMSAAEAYRQYGPPSVDGLSGMDRQMARQAANRAVNAQNFEQRLWRAVHSPRQLQEVLVAFWFNHFNVFRDKGEVRLWITDYENTAIRPYVLGRFRDMLGAVAHHPAMLFYLDNWLSSRDQHDKANGQGRRAGLNENYGRELMELHTLSVNGGYTQQDVIALARALTGWSIDMGGMKKGAARAFMFATNRHDTGPISLLGQALPQMGEAQGEAALDLLARHPATARRIAFKLVQLFVADQPPPDITEALAKTFTRTDGDLRAVMQALVAHPRFWDGASMRSKFKTPYEFTLSAVRASGVAVRNVMPMVNAMQQMGQPLHGWLTPEGYKNTADAWMTPDALLMRIDFAARLANGNLPLLQAPEAITPYAIAAPAAASSAPAASMGATNPKGRLWAPVSQAGVQAVQPGMPAPKPHPANAPPLRVDDLLQTLGPQLSDHTLQTVLQTPPRQQAAALLGSADFMRR